MRLETFVTLFVNSVFVALVGTTGVLAAVVLFP